MYGITPKKRKIQQGDDKEEKQSTEIRKYQENFNENKRQGIKIREIYQKSRKELEKLESNASQVSKSRHI